jgi:hypothetical protein
VIIIIIIIIIYYSILDLLKINFHYFFMYDISDLISQIIDLKGLRYLIFSFIFFF